VFDRVLPGKGRIGRRIIFMVDASVAERQPELSRDLGVLTLEQVK
jgi:hypothetical protein